MYILIEVIERHISEPVFFETHDEAFHNMCRKFAEANGISFEDALAMIGEDSPDGDIQINQDAAWTERYGNNYDWSIFRIESINGGYNGTDRE